MKFRWLLPLLLVAACSHNSPTLPQSTNASDSSPTNTTSASGESGSQRVDTRIGPPDDVLWSDSFGSSGRDMVYGLAPLGDATVLVGEYSQDSDGPPLWSGFVRIVEDDGSLRTEVDLPQARPGSATSVAILDGDIIVGGFASDPESSWVPRRGLLARFAPDGSLRWSQVLEDLRYTTVYDVATLGDRLFAVVGSTESFALKATDQTDSSSNSSTDDPTNSATADSWVEIRELSADGSTLASRKVASMRSQDSSYMLAAGESMLVYVGDVLGPEGGVASEVVAFDYNLKPLWRTIIDDPVLAGVSAVAVGSSESGPVVHLGGHFRERLMIEGRTWPGTTPVRRNGFVASLNSEGGLLGASVILPEAPGDWSTIYALVPLPSGRVLAAGEFLVATRLDSLRLTSSGDLDSLLVYLDHGRVLNAEAFGSPTRDGVLEMRRFTDCSFVLVAATGGGRNDPNGEDVLVFRRLLKSMTSPSLSLC